MILLWGVPTDPPIAAIERILRRERAPYSFLDQRAFLDTEVSLRCDSAIAGTLRVGDDELQLEEVTAVYARPYEFEQIKETAGLDPQSPEFRHAFALQTAVTLWLDLTPALVLNRPREMSLNFSKPYQASIIARSGFAIPDTLLTTDPAAVGRFREKHGSIIYKSVSAARTQVSQLTSADEQRLASVTWCPTQFQQRITGTELRVHVIKDELFACEIVSEADDYRYGALSGHSLDIRPYDLPQECANRCRAVCAAMNFIIGGIDLRSQNGTWYCFEVNPSPGFMYYQKSTGQPIDEAIARLLMEASRPR
jgi:glutathione synthase/RimK-type ligase-like ATP-grasp enzyme